MKTNNNTKTLSFNGYKNILANSIKRSGGEKITYMSMQLDNIGHKDLEVWQAVQKNFLNRNVTSDVITFNLIEYDDMNILGFSHELLNIDEAGVRTKEESIMLKAFSLLASLTKRISKDFILFQDSNRNAMSYETKADLTDLFYNNKRKSAELNRAIREAFHPEIQPQVHAKHINEKISETMMDYFSKKGY